MLRNHLYHGGDQLDLFRPLPARPAWQTLPPAVTQRVQRLLSRLLREHRVGRPAVRGGKEASGD